MPDKVYLDEQGNPIAAKPKVYLNDQGEPTSAPAPSEPSFGSKAYSFAKQHPVEILSTLGAIAAVPLTGGASLLPAIAAAGLGGAGGAGLGLIADAALNNRGPSTPAGVIKRIGTEGAVQGASELIGGGVIQPVMKRGARVLMDNAVRPTETLLREFPDVVDTLVKERLPVGRVLGKSGSQQAKQALRASAKTTRGILKEADAAGAQIQPQQLTAGLPALRASAAKSVGLPGGGTKGLADMEAEFAVAHGAPKTATATKELKQAAQSLAKPVFRAERAGQMVGPDQSMAARFNDAIAGGAKRALEAIPAHGQKIAQSEARTQSLIGATQALRKAEARRLPLWAELASTAAGTAAGAYSGDPGTGLATGLALRALTSPRSVSRGALAMDAASPIGRQATRLAALIAALNEQQP